MQLLVPGSPNRSICVFCGSNPGVNPAYSEAAQALGAAMADANLRLVYGGGNVGLMGILADSVMHAGGSVVGVIPRFLANKELAHPGLTELHEVETMHERKSLMMKLSDAFVALPGGIGTLEEFFEVWTWAQLGLIQKPIGLLNIENLFDPMLQFLDSLVQQRFMKPIHHDLLVVASRPRELLTQLWQRDTPSEDKWLERAAGKI